MKKDPRVKRFETQLKKAGWFTYVDEKTGRVVTNCYEREFDDVQSIVGMPCEFLERDNEFVLKISFVQ